MTTTDGPAVLAEIHNRLHSLEAAMAASAVNNAAAAIAAIEIDVASLEARMTGMTEERMAAMMDAKIAAAAATGGA